MEAIKKISDTQIEIERPKTDIIILTKEDLERQKTNTEEKLVQLNVYLGYFK